jgi:hypothetical protein
LKYSISNIFRSVDNGYRGYRFLYNIYLIQRNRDTGQGRRRFPISRFPISRFFFPVFPIPDFFGEKTGILTIVIKIKTIGGIILKRRSNKMAPVVCTKVVAVSRFPAFFFPVFPFPLFFGEKTGNHES